jgi:hypothetical protein
LNCPAFCKSQGKYLRCPSLSRDRHRTVRHLQGRLPSPDWKMAFIHQACVYFETVLTLTWCLWQHHILPSPMGAKTPTNFTTTPYYAPIFGRFKDANNFYH